MQQPYYCPNCGASVAYNQQFCRSCGITLSWPTQEDFQSYGYSDQNYYQNQQQWQQQQQPRNQWNHPDSGYQQNMQPGSYYRPDSYQQQSQWDNRYQYNNQYQYKRTRQPGKGFPLGLLIAVTVFFIVIGGGAFMYFNGVFDDLLGNGEALNNSGSSSSSAAAVYQEAPEIVIFNISPTSIETGDTAYLTWQVERATSVVIDQGIGSTGTEGSQAVQPPDTTTYNITASNDMGSVSASAQITVIEGEVPVISSFTASSTSITSGDSSTLTWVVTDADSIVINQSIGEVSSNGSESVSPTETTKYTLTATNSTGSSTASVTISVEEEDAPVITVFSSDLYSIASGETVTLEWYVTGADTITIDQGIGTVSAYGSESLDLDETTTFTLTATNDGGSTTADITIYVDPVIEYFTASDYTIDAGDSVTLSWSVTSADYIYIDEGIGEVDETDSISVSPTETTTYTITAENDYTTVTEDITIEVNEE